MEKQQLIQILKTNPNIVVERYFKSERGTPLVLTGYQNRELASMMSALMQDHPGKFVFRQCRRSGKSELISVFIALALRMRPVKIANLSYTADQASIIFERVKAHLVYDSAFVRQFVNFGQSMVNKREFSKTRLHMLNGGSFRTFSTGKGETEYTAESLLGFGCDILIVDEAASISDEVFRTRVLPLIMDARAPKFLLLSGTPHRLGYMHDADLSGKYTSFHVGWQEAVKEGQLSLAELEEAKRTLSAREFKVWWEADWPEDNEDQLIRTEWIERAIRPVKSPGAITYSTLGVDVARYGKDLIVFTHVEFHEGLVVVREIKAYEKLSTMQTVGLIRKFLDTRNVDKIIVDDVGLGAGVVDRLKEIEDLPDVAPFIAGGAPVKTDEVGGRALRDDEKLRNSRFLNKKSFHYAKLAKFFERGAIVIPNHAALKQQLRSIRVETMSDRKTKIVDEKENGKSPDYADSLMMAVSDVGANDFVFSFV